LYDLEENTNDNYNTLEQPSYQKKKKKRAEDTNESKTEIKIKSKPLFLVFHSLDPAEKNYKNQRAGNNLLSLHGSA
jgi:hypothetical protein